MFLLALIVMAALEVFAFIEVGRAIGWLAAVAALLGTSLLGVQVLRIQARTVVERLSLARAKQRSPARVAVDGILGFLGGALLALPGFVSDLFAVMLLFRPTRTLFGRWIARRYAARAMSFLTRAERFAPVARRRRAADVESTVIEEDSDQIER